MESRPRARSTLRLAPLVALAAALLAACGSTGAGGGTGGAGGTDATGGGTGTAGSTGATSTAPPAKPPARATGAAASTPADWTRFGFDAARSNDAPTGLTAAQVRRLNTHTVGLPGTVDASPILLTGVTVKNSRHDILVMTTTYGRTLALDATTLHTLWTFTPASYARVKGTAQITTATPVADPTKKYVYTATPDGHVNRLQTATGRPVTTQHWPAAVTVNPKHERIASSLNVSGNDVLVTTGGYIGDIPPYQGKVLAIDRRTGKPTGVFNSLCSNRRQIIDPSTCTAQESAIWGRAGAVVDPQTHRVYTTSSNGPFDGRTNWGDTVLELSPGITRLLRHWTPSQQRTYEQNDVDLGSTSPALLPDPSTGRVTDLLQGGKDALLHLLSLRTSLHAATSAQGPELGGEVQNLRAPGGQMVFTAPAVMHTKNQTRVFVATNGGTTAYRFASGRLHTVWSNDSPGTSPVVAGNLVYVYDPDGGLAVYAAATGHLVRMLPAAKGHWNSPIVDGGRIYLPTGNANDHATTGALTVFR